MRHKLHSAGRRRTSKRLRRPGRRPALASLMAIASIALAVALGAGGAGAALSNNTISFANVASQVGLGSYAAEGTTIHGPGTIFADLDNDGYADIYAVSREGNRLFLNQPSPTGGRQFQQLADAAGANPGQDSSGAAPGDYDNDGDLDLFIPRFDRTNVLLKNMLVETGTLQFQDVTASTVPNNTVPGTVQAGLASSFDSSGENLARSYTGSWGDVNRDGILDLYVGAHNGSAGNGTLTGGLPGMRDTFYLGQGDGTFLDVTEVYNVTGSGDANGNTRNNAQEYNSSMATMFADVNNDQWPDLIVTTKTFANQRTIDVDQLYLNRGNNGQGDWQGYENATFSLFDGANSTNYSISPMSMAVADVDNDGDFDLTYSDDSATEAGGTPGTNELFINQFNETGQASFIVDHTSVPGGFSWGTVFTDFDNNGWEDLYTAGANCCNRGFNQPDWLYMNTSGQFTEQATAAGVQTGLDSDGRSNATADFDRDGWPDMLQVFNDGTPVSFFQNLGASLHPNRSSISIKLVGDPNSGGAFTSTADAIGARATLRSDIDGSGGVGAGETQIREVASGYNVMSTTSSLELEFGMGVADSGTLTVNWPSGKVTTHNVGPQSYVISEAQGIISSQPFNPPTQSAPTPGFILCAAEGQTCSLPGPATVQYGADGQFVTKSFPTGGNVPCTNAEFGSDPIPGVAKSCSFTGGDGGTPAGFILCATEGQTCLLPGPATVQYGANGQFVTMSYPNGGNIPCTTAEFGSDPIRGVVKSCSYTQSTGFVPDPSKVYHIDNPAHGLRLAARSGSEVLESAALSSTGENTQWRFVQSATSGLWHIQRAAGGNTPRIRTVLSTTPDMQATSSSGDWTRFSIEANASRPGTYLLTVPLANTVNQRLRLLANGTTDFSTNNNVGNNPSFVFTEVN